MAARIIKQYGLSRTGTNATRAVLESNYQCKVLVNEGGWKHGVYSEERVAEHEATGIVVSIRHPLSYLYSRWTVLQSSKEAPLYCGKVRTFAEYIHYDAAPRWELPDMLAWTWSCAYWLWLKDHGQLPVAFLRMEDILVQPEAACTAVAHGLALYRPAGEFKIPHAYAGPHNNRAGDVEAIRDREVGETYREHYGPDLLKYACDRIDWDVAGCFGYGPLGTGGLP